MNFSSLANLTLNILDPLLIRFIQTWNFIMNLPNKPQCTFDGCSRQVKVRGYCINHYQTMRYHGALKPVRTYRLKKEHCLVPTCTIFQISKGYCYRHYQQIRRHGRLMPETEKSSRAQTKIENGNTAPFSISAQHSSK